MERGFMIPNLGGGQRSQVNAPKPTVLSDNAGKSYRSVKGAKNFVFKHVNLTLPRGTVYGLLGPSGCGKTSLIRCILGRLNLDQGSIFVFGHRPGTEGSGVPGPSVGYMTQESCIPGTLTIAQCWTYYGTILGLPKTQINCAIKYFIQLLNLPPANTVNSQLSGGELRRVAFATALIHEPKLLVLDEPTVGIDCITKKNMWEHILKLAAEKQTSTILTTHYIEEARAAHKVGLMHGDTLAVEDYTENLLQKFNCTTLESVFIKICSKTDPVTDFDEARVESADVWIPMKKMEHIRVQRSAEDEIVEPEQSGLGVRCGPSRWLSPRVFRVKSFVLRALILRYWIHLYRFPGALFFAMMLPCIQLCCSIFTFSEIVGQAQFSLINEDVGHFGNKYLEFLDKDIVDLRYFNSTSEAFEAFRDGRVQGFIHIRPNFSKSHLDRILNSPLVNTDIFNDSFISVMLDHVDGQSQFLGLHLTSVYERFLYATYNETGLNYLVARPVIYFEKKFVDYVSTPRNLLQSISLMTVASFFAPAAIACLTLFVDLNLNYLEKIVVAGVTETEILLGIMVILMTCAIVQMILLIIGAFVFALRALTLGSFFLLFFILYCHGMSGAAVGIFLSTMYGQVNILCITMAYLLLFSAIASGGFWPLLSMPYFFRIMCLVFPGAYQVQAITTIYLGTNFYVSELMFSLAISLTYTVVFLAISVFTLRKKL